VPLKSGEGAFGGPTRPPWTGLRRPVRRRPLLRAGAHGSVRDIAGNLQARKGSGSALCRHPRARDRLPYRPSADVLGFFTSAVAAFAGTGLAAGAGGPLSGHDTVAVARAGLRMGKNGSITGTPDQSSLISTRAHRRPSTRRSATSSAAADRRSLPCTRSVERHCSYKSPRSTCASSRPMCRSGAHCWRHRANGG